MKLLIEIDEAQKKMVDASMELPPQVENDLISAIRHGKPLDSVLDEIRAEIEKLPSELTYDGRRMIRRVRVYDIIDKYKAESEDKECR